jgi:tRNA (guanine-N7-)-methyltransferase
VRARQHVNPLGINYEEFRGEKPRLDPGREIEIEVGCAEAQFLFERAKRDPARVYLGLEVRRSLVDSVNAEAEREGLPVQAIFCNVNKHLRVLFSDRAVSRAFVNFPDPWFKRRHRKRRIVDAAFARDLHAVLRTGAEVFLQTDVWDVALDAMDVFERLDEQYRNAREPWAFWRDGNPFGARSWRETHCIEHGLRIWRLLYRAR